MTDYNGQRDKRTNERTDGRTDGRRDASFRPSVRLSIRWISTLRMQWRRNEFTSSAKRRKNFSLCLSTFLTLQVQSLQLVFLINAFVMVGTVWSVSCLLFFCILMVPHAQPVVKVGHVPPCLWSRRHC